MDITLLNKLLNYENSIFNKYITKRKLLIEKINSIETNKLDNSQLLIFINDIKDVLDPIKSSCENIDHLLSNVDFKNNKSFQSNKDILNIIIMFYLFKDRLDLNLTSSEESEETELTDSSESESEPDSDSESSKSESLTFSRQ